MSNKLEQLIKSLQEFREEYKLEDLEKGEKGQTKHDRCARKVAAQGNVDNPHAVCVAAGVEPEKWKKSVGEKLSLHKNGQWSLNKE